MVVAAAEVVVGLAIIMTDLPHPPLGVGRRRQPAEVLRGTDADRSSCADRRGCAAGRRRLRAAWLLIALPLLGAAVLLLGGRRTDRWGHWLGVAPPVGVVRARPWSASSTCSARPAEERAVSQHLFDWIAGRATSRSTSACCSTRCRSVFVLLITGVGVADPHLLGRLHGARPEPAPVLRLPQPVRRGDAAAGAGRQLPAALRRLGGRRPGVVPADRRSGTHKPGAATAAKKAFVVNRVGDIGPVDRASC